jgi:lipid II:glycine glycyltransferase (peptidoglycan interpeptide bridge formation enzyme)
MNLILLEEPDEKWDQFVGKHSGLLFHTSEWWKVLKQGYGCPTRYLILEKDGEWSCALPGTVVGNRFFRVFYSLIPLGGFVGDRRQIPEFLALLNQWATNQKIHRIQIVDPTIKEKRELPDFNCVESFRHLLKLKGKSPDQILGGYDESVRRNLRKASKSGLYVEAIRQRGEIENFYRLYLESMQRNRALAKYPLQLFYGIYDLLVREKAEMLFAKSQGRSVAGMVLVHSQDTTHYFHGGSETRSLQLRPNDLLFHHAIQSAKEKGMKFFDFFGSAKNLVSLIRFKDKWGTHREELLNFHRDLGTLRPLAFRLGLKLAQTSFGSAIHRAFRSGENRGKK